MANLKKKKKYQMGSFGEKETQAKVDSIIASRQANLDAYYDPVRAIVKDHNTASGTVANDGVELTLEEKALKEKKLLAAAKAGQSNPKPGPYEYKKGGTKKKFVPATDEEIAAAGKRNPPLAYMAAQSVAKQERVWVKKKKMGGVKELYKKGGVKKSTASEFLEPPSAYNLDS